MHEQVESISRLVDMEGDYHGHDGMRRWWANLLGTFPDWRLDPLEVRELGEDLTLAVVRTHGHGAGSRTPVEQTIWHLGEWRDGQVVRWQTFVSEAEALEAVGLPE